MSRIFLSHSSKNNAEALALRDWLASQGWHDVFLDIDPVRGLVAADRWQKALNTALGRCRAVIFLLSPEWCASKHCISELELARHVGAELIGVIVKAIDFAQIPVGLGGENQLVNLTRGGTKIEFAVNPPPERKLETVCFSEEDLKGLRSGLARLGLVGFDTESFPWPPPGEPERVPFRGLEALDLNDAGVFFGRDADLVRARESLIDLRRKGGRKLFTIVGASGSGKSSFLRAGLWPRLEREDRDFVILPLVRPTKLALSGVQGLGASLETAFSRLGEQKLLGDLIVALGCEDQALPPLLNELQVRTMQRLAGDAKPQVERPPTLILPIDQAEEMFAANGGPEAVKLRHHLASALTRGPDTIGLLTIRSDQLPLIQNDELLGPLLDPFNLPPMSPMVYRDTIVRPAARVVPPLEIDPLLISTLIADTANEGADPLPLLAFTLAQLYRNYRKAAGGLRQPHYAALGGIGGSIDQALKDAFSGANTKVSGAGTEQNLRRLIMPKLATWDDEARPPAAKRQVALEAEVIEQDKADLAALADALVNVRLLIRGEQTIEVAHEALLRRQPIAGWIEKQKESLKLRDEVVREAENWTDRGRIADDLNRRGTRLEAALSLQGSEDFAGRLGKRADSYLAACAKQETAGRRAARRRQVAIYTLLVGIIAGLVAFINQDLLKQKYTWHVVMQPSLLTAEQEKEAASGSEMTFAECANGCPTLVVIPAGNFDMGSATGENDERPLHEVKFAKPFAVSRTEVTFVQWDACVASGGCVKLFDSTWGRTGEWGDRPAVLVNWDEAKEYAAWLSKLTGKEYRLLTEAEWEYSARAGSPGKWSFGDDETRISNYAWYKENSDGKTQPVSKTLPNAFGLYDMHGNVSEWVEDCFADTYTEAPTDGSAVHLPDCEQRVVRGGSWNNDPVVLRSANRMKGPPDYRYNSLGFRVARTLGPPTAN